MTDAQLLANCFDTRNMIGCSARATTDSKFFLTVVEIGIICIYYERPGPDYIHGSRCHMASQSAWACVRGEASTQVSEARKAANKYLSWHR